MGSWKYVGRSLACVYVQHLFHQSILLFFLEQEKMHRTGCFSKDDSSDFFLISQRKISAAQRISQEKERQKIGTKDQFIDSSHIYIHTLVVKSHEMRILGERLLSCRSPNLRHIYTYTSPTSHNKYARPLKNKHLISSSLQPPLLTILRRWFARLMITRARAS